jgi:hypothetical protein
MRCISGIPVFQSWVLLIYATGLAREARAANRAYAWGVLTFGESLGELFGDVCPVYYSRVYGK